MKTMPKRTTDLEDKLAICLNVIKNYLTQRTLNKRDYSDLMNTVMDGILQYEDKKYGIHRMGYKTAKPK